MGAKKRNRYQRNRRQLDLTDFDRETNLHYNGARYYDPAAGRYPTPDPLGLRGDDLSLYLYAKNNPLSHIDPRGESTGWVILVLIGVTGYYGYQMWQVAAPAYQGSQALGQQTGRKCIGNAK